MSEAMTDPEIEDILASIRRLVAQERRPRPERLILTEEFRVRQANIPAPPLFPHAPPGAPSAARPSVTEAVAEVVRASRAEVARAEPVPRVAPEARVTPPVAAPDAATQPAPSAGAPLSPSPLAPAPAAAEVPDAPDPEALEASLRELEARIPEPPPEPRPAEPAGAGRAVAQGEIMGDDVAFIDEDDLERMVARIVREELRGQLGERITAQVRKLVRAEIARALDERNLLG